MRGGTKQNEGLGPASTPDPRTFATYRGCEDIHNQRARLSIEGGGMPVFIL